ncbi:hypothetical protein BDP27DRAFT_428650 [Rhodocollybia butyracea]|uniref:Uncharacterized protein n=1 Tax=Rhodocollybia butyracea TaxID=206335 RepID=A0A9P5UAU0_9AGAR|nr:hypothetical protein BDP27DRAFT_428650 [Rhodocollybia butyracea]
MESPISALNNIHPATMTTLAKYTQYAAGVAPANHSLEHHIRHHLAQQQPQAEPSSSTSALPKTTQAQQTVTNVVATEVQSGSRPETSSSSPPLQQSPNGKAPRLAKTAVHLKHLCGGEILTEISSVMLVVFTQRLERDVDPQPYPKNRQSVQIHLKHSLIRSRPLPSPIFSVSFLLPQTATHLRYLSSALVHLPTGLYHRHLINNRCLLPCRTQPQSSLQVLLLLLLLQLILHLL